MKTKHFVLGIFALLFSIALYYIAMFNVPIILAEESVEESFDILSEFEQIDIDTLNVILEEKQIRSVVSNAGTSHLFISCEDGTKYIIEDDEENGIISNYLIFNGYTIKTVSLPESLEDIEKNAENENMSKVGQLLLNGIPIFCILLLAIFVYKKSVKKESVPAIPAIKNAEGNVIEEEIPLVTFEDVEGIDELKADIMRIVDCLKNPEKYKRIGARIPKGIILYGPPGTGKTLLAKAIAGEASVPFFSAVGSDFVEKYVGVGASRVRELYKKAKKEAPCIVFIDEIDAVASQRTNDSNGEKDQTINALLAELDGFEGTEGIVTICATNRLDMLDSAFQRAGRFDLKLAVGLPDKKSRRKILDIHSKSKMLDETVNLDSLAVKTQGFSGADLEALLNESAMIAVGKNKEFIDNEDIDDAFFKIVLQGNKKKREEITETNKVIAWHESGHTLATKLLTNMSVSSVTIVGSSSGTGGVTFVNEPEEKILYSKVDLENQIKIKYAGRAAEELYFGNEDKITTGASQDIKQATSVLKEYLSLYGMGNMGMIDLSQFRNDFQDIVNEASDLAKRLYKEVLDLLRKNIKVLEDLSEALLKSETLTEEDIDNIISKYK